MIRGQKTLRTNTCIKLNTSFSLRKHCTARAPARHYIPWGGWSVARYITEFDKMNNLTKVPFILNEKEIQL